MISVDIGGCKVDMIPVVRGLVSEYDRVKEIVNGSYDTFAVSLGKEDIIAVGMRKELEEDLYIEDVDVVYLHYLSRFGETATPAPAFSALVDTCNELSRPVQPLDMDEESFSKVYCDIISTFELLGESRLARKAVKKKFDMSSAENFVISWDGFVNRSKGFRELTRLREKYMANRIRLLAKSSERMLAVVETERINGIISILNGNV
ncbi:MAG: hypothetical protein LBE47_02405 [Methanomassiliicoccaceae archaeon]|jgi:pheromone shutdown protein TraB|nr:hypothetical protein [Methanomassiliicoccaceae archaeon]